MGAGCSNLELADEKYSLTLANGAKLPRVGHGTYLYPQNNEDAYQAVRAAIQIGYRHIDTSPWYMNEAEVGRAIVDELYPEGLFEAKVKRDQLFITGKLWNTHHGKGHVVEALERTLRNLKVDYLDLYLMQWPMAFKYTGSGKGNCTPSELYPVDDDGALFLEDVDYLKTWKRMEKLVDSGKVNAIGVCNFNIEQLSRLLSNCRIKPAVLMTEMNPYLQNDELIKFCNKYGIVLVAYAPFAAPYRDWRRQSPASPLFDERVKRMAKSKGIQPGQLILRFMMEKGIGVVVGSRHKRHMEANLSMENFQLTDQDKKTMERLHLGWRLFHCSQSFHHSPPPYYPF